MHKSVQNPVQQSRTMALQPLPSHAATGEDPTFWLLNAHVGWRAAAISDKIEIAPPQGLLTLKRVVQGNRLVTEASGSFGGLGPPSHVAQAPNGDLYLLDAATGQLLIFDPCCCCFAPLPCFTGVNSGARTLQGARAIAICNGNLYVAHPSQQVIKVFSLHGFVLRALWKPPASANLPNWQPQATACDQKGCIYVTDPVNGLIHRFTASGRWSRFAAGSGDAAAIAIDCDGRVYAAGSQELFLFDTEGQPLASSLYAADFGDRFEALDFAVDAKGNLNLTQLCQNAKAAPSASKGKAQESASYWFDLHGKPIPANNETTVAPSYEKRGQFYTTALDSRLYRCQWHRVVLYGRIPAGSRVTVATYSAEAELSEESVSTLDEPLWLTQQTTHQLGPEGWDCLIRSGGGRYLWLRLTLESNGALTPCLDAIRVEYPRVTLRRYLPAVFGADGVSADFTDRLLSIFDTTMRDIEAQIDTQARFFDAMSAPATVSNRGEVDFLTWLASWLGLLLDRQLPEAQRRRMVANASRLYHLRGTREGLWRLLLLFLDIDPNTPEKSAGCSDANCACGCAANNRCEPLPLNCAPPAKPCCAWQPPRLILEHYQLRRWLFVSAGRLGDQAEVWGRSIVNRTQLDENARVGGTQLIATQDPQRDPFHVYAHKFTVFVPARFGCTEGARRSLHNLIRLETPAHTVMNVEYVEPRMRIGFQSTIGLNSVVGRYPQGVTMNETRLGQSSVLSAGHNSGDNTGPLMQIGQRSRVGGTTRLE